MDREGLDADAAVRLRRRVRAMERLVAAVARVQVEVVTPPGTAAIAGEEFTCAVRILTGGGAQPAVRAEGLGGGADAGCGFP